MLLPILATSYTENFVPCGLAVHLSWKLTRYGAEATRNIKHTKRRPSFEKNYRHSVVYNFAVSHHNNGARKKISCFSKQNLCLPRAIRVRTRSIEQVASDRSGNERAVVASQPRLLLRLDESLKMSLQTFGLLEGFRLNSCSI